MSSRPKASTFLNMTEQTILSLLILLDCLQGVNKYLEFKQVDGSYVLKDGKISKVPATETEALATPLVGFFEKRRLRKFVMYVQDYEADKPATHQVPSSSNIFLASRIALCQYMSVRFELTLFSFHACLVRFSRTQRCPTLIFLAIAPL